MTPLDIVVLVLLVVSLICALTAFWRPGYHGLTASTLLTTVAVLIMFLTQAKVIVQ